MGFTFQVTVHRKSTGVISDYIRTPQRYYIILIWEEAFFQLIKTKKGAFLDAPFGL
jgi:hypothetical protein